MDGSPAKGRCFVVLFKQFIKFGLGDFAVCAGGAFASFCKRHLAIAASCNIIMTVSGVNSSMASLAGGNYAVKQVYAVFHGVKNILDSADAEQMARFFFRQAGYDYF